MILSLLILLTCFGHWDSIIRGTKLWKESRAYISSYAIFYTLYMVIFNIVLLYLNTYSLFTLLRSFCKSVIVEFNFQVHFELNVISLMFNLFVIQCVPRPQCCKCSPTVYTCVVMNSTHFYSYFNMFQYLLTLIRDIFVQGVMELIHLQ